MSSYMYTCTHAQREGREAHTWISWFLVDSASSSENIYTMAYLRFFSQPQLFSYTHIYHPTPQTQLFPYQFLSFLLFTKTPTSAFLALRDFFLSLSHNFPIRCGQTHTHTHTVCSLTPSTPTWVFIQHFHTCPHRARATAFPMSSCLIISYSSLSSATSFPFSRYMGHVPVSGDHVHKNTFHPIVTVLLAPCLPPLRLLLLKLNEVLQRKTLSGADWCTHSPSPNFPVSFLSFNFIDLDKHLKSEPLHIFFWSSFSDLVPWVWIHIAKPSFTTLSVHKSMWSNIFYPSPFTCLCSYWPVRAHTQLLIWNSDQSDSCPWCLHTPT